MSAIWGVWRRGGARRAMQDIEQMQQSLAEYGRDGQRLWSCPSQHVGMGLAATFTLPEDDSDTQPYTTGDGSVLMGHVRLDNRDDLARDLGIRSIAGIPDTEILAEAWERWGDQTPERLLGAFAFAVWMPRKRRLVCVRDPLGTRPLHFAVEHSLFAFATLPKGLHALDEFPRRLDQEMLAGRLALLPEGGDQSFFENVLRVPPSHMVVATERSHELLRYRAFDLARRISFRRDSDYVEAFTEIFDEAVRCRLRSRTPIGSQLSGGLDSTSVATSAAIQLANLGSTLNAYTSVPGPDFGKRTSGPCALDNRFGDEGPHASSVARMYPGVRHHLVPPLVACPLDLIGEHQKWTDTPGGHFCMTPYAQAIDDLQKQHGVQTILGGVGGNHTISYDGLYLLPALVRDGDWIRWWREGQALRQSGYLPRWRSIGLVSFAPMVPSMLWKLLLRERPDRVLGRFTAGTMLAPEWIRSGELEKLAKARDWDVWRKPAGDGRAARLRALGRGDGAGSVSPGSPTGTDYRDPTTDIRVIDFLLAIPEEQFLRNGQTKWLLRRAMADRLSTMVLEERRKGLVGADWYRQVAPYRDRFAAAVDDFQNSALLRRLLDLPRMQGLINRWPRDQWDSMRVQTEYRHGLCRAVAAGHFVRMVEQGTRGA